MLKQYVALRRQLADEKARIEARLQEINEALGPVGASDAAPAAAAGGGRKPRAAKVAKTRAKAAGGARRGRKPAAATTDAKPDGKPASKGPKGRRGPRAKNSMSLGEAIIKVTQEAPKTAQEILEAVKGIGYKFKAKDPLNSLRTVLYSRKDLKNHGGKFGPA